MNHRQARLWVWWLLPIMAARALVPAGFMADVASGDFRLVICSGIAALNTSIADHDVHDAITHSQSRHSPTHVLCPFAASAGAALAMALSAAMLVFQLITCALTYRNAAIVANHRYAAHAIRGPPLFS
ncbi:MAG TPA: hypothetical protein VG962_07825 [Steroidobacteraceae bacterium]|jgi:hypothetical protein|nr:hypothetical protein [Steroidobacteraceae bacterium]